MITCISNNILDSCYFQALSHFTDHNETQSEEERDSKYESLSEVRSPKHFGNQDSPFDSVGSQDLYVEESKLNFEPFLSGHLAAVRNR